MREVCEIYSIELDEERVIIPLMLVWQRLRSHDGIGYPVQLKTRFNHDWVISEFSFNGFQAGTTKEDITGFDI